MGHNLRKDLQMRLLIFPVVIFTYLISGCSFSKRYPIYYDLQVFDADTEKPIKGAVINVRGMVG